MSIHDLKSDEIRATSGGVSASGEFLPVYVVCPPLVKPIALESNSSEPVVRFIPLQYRLEGSLPPC